MSKVKAGRKQTFPFMNVHEILHGNFNEVVGIFVTGCWILQINWKPNQKFYITNSKKFKFHEFNWLPM